MKEQMKISEEKLREILDFIKNPPIERPSSKDYLFSFAVLCLNEMKYWEIWRHLKTEKKKVFGHICSESRGEFLDVIGDKHYHFASIKHGEDHIKAMTSFIRSFIDVLNKGRR